VNKDMLAFQNFVALPETMLLVSFLQISKTCAIDFLIMRTRGLCEDGQTRFVGWNRLWRPERNRWERVSSVEAKKLCPGTGDSYPFPPVRFEALWEY
jgi:hypothetical protein